MKEKYDAGDSTTLLTRDEILEAARELMRQYGTEEAYQQAFLEYENNPENHKWLAEIKRRYGLV